MLYPKSVLRLLLPLHSFFFRFQASLEHISNSISISTSYVNSSWPRFLNTSQFSHINISAATTNTLWMGPSWCYPTQLCLWIVPWCCLSRNPANCAFFHSLEASRLSWLYLSHSSFNSNSVYLSLIVPISTALLKCNQWSLWSSPLCSTPQDSSKGIMPAIPLMLISGVQLKTGIISQRGFTGVLQVSEMIVLVK